MSCDATSVPFADDWLMILRQWSPFWWNDAMVVLSHIAGENGYIFILVSGLALGIPKMRALVYVFLFSVTLNTLLKGLVMECRPGLMHLMEAGGFSFPSGHAQGAATFWGFWAFTSRRRSHIVWAIVFTALVAFARNVVGVHYVHDVLVGACLGFLIAYIFSRESPRGLFRTDSLLWGLFWGVLAAICLPIVNAGKDQEFIKALSSFLGMVAGLFVSRHWALPKTFGERVQSLVIAWCGVVAILVYLKQSFLHLGFDHVFFVSFRYFLATFWVLVIPSLFNHVRRL